ncbi:MAG TPA: GatB/YqeY domain-containing protein [Micropepsaceae bacterium]|nr:GatB/YqeY domain-containing protein [Micropepsaceae bacterium]
MRDRLTDAMKTAMKAKETKRLGTIRLMLADIQKQGITAKNENLSDDEMLTVLAKMIKQREDSATAYDQGGRPELAAAERDEILVIREFMPKQMSDEETRAAVKEAIAAAGATSLKDMGKVMAALKERHTGAMDFGKASPLVKELLAK